MRNYSNLHEWGTGIGGRHPFGGKDGGGRRGGFRAEPSLVGRFVGAGDSFDRGLAADYLRLLHKRDTRTPSFQRERSGNLQDPQGSSSTTTVRRASSAVPVG